jgi:hypothetical protein
MSSKTKSGKFEVKDGKSCILLMADYPKCNRGFVAAKDSGLQYFGCYQDGQKQNWYSAKCVCALFGQGTNNRPRLLRAVDKCDKKEMQVCSGSCLKGWVLISARCRPRRSKAAASASCT